eukprot:gene8249-9130_t
MSSKFPRLIVQPLRDLCLRNVAQDDVLERYGDRIQDVPMGVVPELVTKISIYGLHLLEYHNILSVEETEPLWKKAYETDCKNAISTGKSTFLYLNKNNTTSFKSLLCQNIFLRILEFMADNSSSPDYLSDCYLHFPIEEDVPCWSDIQFVNVLCLIKLNLKQVIICPSFLHPLNDLFHQDYFQGFTGQVTHVDFHTFRFDLHQLTLLRDFFHSSNFPNISSLKFKYCKWNRESLLEVKRMIKPSLKDCSHHLEQIYSGTTSLEDNKLDQTDLLKKDLDYDGYYDDFGPIMRKRLKAKEIDSDKEVSFDEALSCTDVAKEENDLYDFTYNSIESSNTSRNKTTFDLEELGFINSHISDEDLSILCRIIELFPNLKTFTIQPKLCHSFNLYKILTAVFSCSTTPSSEEISSVRTPVIESLSIHDTKIDYFCKKLLLWHHPGECKKQWDVSVPSLKHLELVDCCICDCKSVDHYNCVGYGDPYSQDYPVKCALYFDIDQMCTCNWVRLETLDFSETNIGCEGAKAIGKALTGVMCLQRLNMSDCQLETEGCGYVFAMAKAHPSLKVLKISENSYDTATDNSLADLIEQDNLVQLEINQCIVKHCLSKSLLAAFKKNSRITHLALGANRLGDVGMVKLSTVLTEKTALSSLRTLNL